MQHVKRVRLGAVLVDGEERRRTGEGSGCKRDRLRPAGFEVPVSHSVLRRSEPHPSLFCC